MGKFVSAFFANPKLRIGGLLAALITAGSAVSEMNSTYDNAHSLFAKAEVLWGYLATPWLGAAVLFVIAYLFWTGLKDVNEALKKGDEASVQLLKRIEEERQAIARAMQPVHRLAYLNLQLVELRRVQSELPVLQGELREYGKSVSKLSRLDTPFEVTPGYEVLPSCSRIVERIDALAAQASIAQIGDLRSPAPVCDPIQESPTPEGSFQRVARAAFDPLKNKPFIKAHEANVTELDNAMTRILTDVRRKIEGHERETEEVVRMLAHDPSPQ